VGLRKLLDSETTARVCPLEVRAKRDWPAAAPVEEKEREGLRAPAPRARCMMTLASGSIGGACTGLAMDVLVAAAKLAE
jgi:hypothetical protein